MRTTLTCVLSLVCACSNPTVPDSGAPDSGAPDAGSLDAGSPPTFAQIYTNIISVQCAPCRTTTSDAGIGISEGKLDMTSAANAYANLVNQPAAGVACAGKGKRIVPNMPDSSIAYLKISLDDPTPCGDKMPYFAPPLSQADADAIEAWINAGAQNN